MWANRIKFSKLEIKLLFNVLLTALICIFIYIVMTNITAYYMNHLRVDLNTYKEQLNIVADDFQNYITDNNISINDINAIRSWDKKQRLMHMKLVENNKVMYDSLDYITSFTPKISYTYFQPIKDFSHTINFTDGQAVMYITILYRQRIEQRLNNIILIVCILLFVTAILSEFKKLVRDILNIKRGIQILEGGDLTYEIQSKRKDEITDLAASINRMSKELDLQKKEEDNLRQKNYDLVTSISHDIRTPLTTINSYIDLIFERKYADLQELNRYLEKIKEKSILINDLTDNLFTHFINQSSDYKYNFEIIIGNDFIKYLLSSMEEGLRDKGYQMVSEFEFSEEFFMKIDVMQIQRVFNNLEGNLLKYANKSKPIIYSAHLRNNIIMITGQNSILNSDHLDSHGLGIINSQEIIHTHSGEMRNYIEGDIYHVEFSIPAYLI